MEESKIRQIKGALLKCAEENRNKPTPTFNICISALCIDAEQYIRELEAQIEKMKQDLDNARESANKQEQWEIYSVLNDIYNDNFEVITSVSN